MNKREAEAIGRDIARHGLQVTGYRRYDYGKRGVSWAVDVLDTKTGYPFTVDDAAQWHKRKFDAGMEAVAATPGRPPLSPDGVRMTYHSLAMPDALWEWAERDGTRSANVRKAVDAVRLLTPEQWAWLAEYGDTAKALADAVQQAWDMERAEAEAEALAPTYNGGRW